MRGKKILCAVSAAAIAFSAVGCGGGTGGGTESASESSNDVPKDPDPTVKTIDDALFANPSLADRPMV